MGFWSRRRVLVAGGAGFVGSHVTEALVADGAQVRVADSLLRGSTDNLASVIDEVEFLELELSQPSHAARAVAGCDAVFNLVSRVGGIEFNRTHQAAMLSGSALPAMQVMDAAAAAGVERFLAVSSACVYPADAPVPTPENYGFAGEPEATNLGYGLAKRMVEYHARFLAAEASMKIAVVRPYNAYGPRDHFDLSTSHVVAALIKRAADGEDPFTVWGTGNPTRAFIYVKDLSRAMLLALERKDDGEPINLGSDQEVRIRDLAGLVLKAAAGSPQLEFDASKPDGYARRAADTTLMRNVMPELFPLTPLAEGLAETFAWYQSSLTPR